MLQRRSAITAAALLLVVLLGATFASVAVAADDDSAAAAAASAAAVDPLDIPALDAGLLARFNEKQHGDELTFLASNPGNGIETLIDETVFHQINGMLVLSEQGMMKKSKKQSVASVASKELYDGTMTPSMFVLYYAPWCQHCKAIKPVFRNASAAVAFQSVVPNPSLFGSSKGGMPPKPFVRRGARFGLLDATANGLSAKTFRVRGYPHFGYFLPVLAWDAAGNAVRRMAGFPYQGGRDAGSFEFAARYIDLGLRRGFVTAANSIDDVMSLRNVEPPRVLYLVGPARNVSSLWNTVAPPAFIAAALTSGKAHFGTYAALEVQPAQAQQATTTTKKKKNDGDSDEEDGAEDESKQQPTMTREQRLLHENLVAAMAKATRGPNGEYMICVTDLEGPFGAVPFTGTWPAPVPAHVSYAEHVKQHKQQQQKKKAADTASEGEAAAATAATAEEEESEEEAAKKEHLHAVRSLSLGAIIDSQVVQFIQRMSFLPVEQVSAPVFQQLSQEGRYICLGVLRGTVAGRTPQQIALEQQRAQLTLGNYLMRRRSELRESFEPKRARALAEMKAIDDAASKKEAGEQEIASEKASGGDAPSFSGNAEQAAARRAELQAELDLYNFALNILRTSTALPVFKNKEKAAAKAAAAAAAGTAKYTERGSVRAQEEKLFFATIDGGMFADFMADLGVKDAPTVVVYDTQEQAVFQDTDLFNNLVNLEEAWNGAKRPNEADATTTAATTADKTSKKAAASGSGGVPKFHDALLSQAVDAVAVLVQRIDDGDLSDVPINWLGRIARTLTTYIPGLQRAKEYFGWDATALCAIVGGTVFAVLVFLLAARPTDDERDEHMRAMTADRKARIKELQKRQEQRRKEQEQQQQQQQQQPSSSTSASNKRPGAGKSRAEVLAAASAAAAATAKPAQAGAPPSDSDEEEEEEEGQE